MPDDPYAVDVIFGRYEDGDGGGCDNFGRCVTFGTVAAGTGGAGTGDGVTTAGGADIFFFISICFSEDYYRFYLLYSSQFEH